MVEYYGLCHNDRRAFGFGVLLEVDRMERGLIEGQFQLIWWQAIVSTSDLQS